MRILSRKALLALEAVIDVAIYARPEPVQARDITERQNVPQRYLEQIMQALVRADILRGVRGPRGGYRLARERRRITVGEIISVIVDLENSDQNLPLSSDIGRAVVLPFCTQLTAHLGQFLDEVTIEDLCQQAPTPTPAGAMESGDDFII